MKSHTSQKKTWIDWIKVIVAIDIASVGIGLVFNIDSFHILADILGSISRIIFGILYVFVAYLIFKRVFPVHLFDNEAKEKRHEFVEKIDNFSDKVVDTIDDLGKKGKDFAHKRIAEAKEEIERLEKE